MTNDTKWIIWYGDGSSIDWTQMSPHEVPRWGVVCVTQESAEHGRVLWNNGDYYFYEDNQWMRCDFIGLIDYITRPDPYKIILIGRMISNNKYMEIFRRACEDTRLQAKSSSNHLEVLYELQRVNGVAIDNPRPDELV